MRGNRSPRQRILRTFPFHEKAMRKVRIVVLLIVAATAFTACKKGGGYITEPAAVATP
jgi:hypothetical protein